MPVSFRRTTRSHTHASGRLIVSAIAALALLSSPTLARSDVERVVTFGASLSDTGNAFIWLSQPENQTCGTRLNVPPYDALDDLATPGGPYAKGGHHFSNGAIWVEGLARDLALSGNERPAFQNAGTEATNYAVGGARAVADYPCRFNLPAQVGAYLADFPHTSTSTLVTIEIGGNDVRDALFAAASGQDPSPLLEGALSSLADSISRLYLGGARTFLVLNVPDVGKTPAVRTLDQSFPGTAAFAGALSQAYNAGLLARLQGLAAALPGIDIRVLDVYATLNAVVANPETYGFSNATDACVTPNHAPFICQQPDRYVFWDGIHPTKALHALVAQRALDVLWHP